MKALNVYFEDDEFEKLLKLKNSMNFKSWRDFINKNCGDKKC